MPLHDEIDHETVSNVHPRWRIVTGNTIDLKEYNQFALVDRLVMDENASVLMAEGAEFIFLE
jgi:hypothetical protein